VYEKEILGSKAVMEDARRITVKIASKSSGL
jgi:hypothetical protein